MLVHKADGYELHRFENGYAVSIKNENGDYSGYRPVYTISHTLYDTDNHGRVFSCTTTYHNLYYNECIDIMRGISDEKS